MTPSISLPCQERRGASIALTAPNDTCGPAGVGPPIARPRWATRTSAPGSPEMLAGVRGDVLWAQVNVGEAERRQVGAGVAAYKLGLAFAFIRQNDVDLVLALDDMVGGEDNGCGVGAPDDASCRLAGPGCDSDNRPRRVLDNACQLIGKLTQCG